MNSILYTLLIGVFEAYGLIYFLDSYMECGYKGIKRVIRFLVFYIIFVGVVIL